MSCTNKLFRLLVFTRAHFGYAMSIDGTVFWSVSQLVRDMEGSYRVEKKLKEKLILIINLLPKCVQNINRNFDQEWIGPKTQP